jgi:hypothetical protein
MDEQNAESATNEARLVEPAVTDVQRSPPIILPSLRQLVYADDTVVILQISNDFQILQSLLETYSAASNAKLNYDKTIAFALNCNPTKEWTNFLAEH